MSRSSPRVPRRRADSQVFRGEGQERAQRASEPREVLRARRQSPLGCELGAGASAKRERLQISFSRAQRVSEPLEKSSRGRNRGGEPLEIAEARGLCPRASAIRVEARGIEPRSEKRSTTTT